MGDNNYIHKYNLNEFNDPKKFQDQIEIDKFPIETFIDGLKTMKLIN